MVRHRGWLQPRGIGCLLVVFVIIAGWLVSKVVAGFNSLLSSPPVAGNPLSTVVPVRPAGSGSLTIDRITQRGKLIVAIQEAPGLAQRSPGGYSGFDIALLDLIAQDLAVDPARTSFKLLPTGIRETALERGDVDLVLGGYEITPALTAKGDIKVDIVGPYLVRPLQLAVPAASSVRDLGSLGQGKVCAPEGSTAAAALVDHGVTPQTRSTLAACADLLGGRVEAIADDQAAVTAVLSRAPGTLRVLREQLGNTEYGISLPHGDPVLHDRITATLRHVINDGIWVRLYARYLGTPVPDPPVLR
jgi:ABC-type amino acid transport substrate-binding protein